MKKVMVVIPTYNERKNIEALIPAILNVAPDFHVVVVDDNSPDGTGGFVEDLGKKNSQIHVIRRRGKLGLGTAYIEGFKYALRERADYIFQMDADFSHDPRYMPDFIEKMSEYDVVLGSRYINGISVVNWDFKRLLLSKGATKYVNMITGLGLTDTTGGFKCFRREAMVGINLDKIRSTGYSFQIEMSFMTKEKGFRIGETPIIFVDRHVGTTKMSLGIAIEAVCMVWMLAGRRVIVPAWRVVMAVKQIFLERIRLLRPVEVSS
ncbi:polyprenol monophosphomannose synthase [Candidatus Desantisbacteria bacterium]|nr:polyprenol monophosphomannose synthase [Candidatus Desantisbacteria bacterium]